MDESTEKVPGKDASSVYGQVLSNDLHLDHVSNVSSLRISGQPEDDSLKKEIVGLIERGDHLRLQTVLSRLQPSHEQLRTEPYVSMMYGAARAGHVEVMEMLYQWCGERCLYWADPVTGSYALHVAADRGHYEALVWLLTHHGARQQRNFDVHKLKNNWSESPVDICTRQSQKYPDCQRAMQAYLKSEASMTENCVQRSCGEVVVRTYNRAFARCVAISPLIGDRNVPFDRANVSIEQLCDGLVKEGREYLCGRLAYADWSKIRADHLQKKEPSQSGFWTRHPTPEQIAARLREAFLCCSDRLVFDAAVEVYNDR
eukprot:RCo009273